MTRAVARALLVLGIVGAVVGLAKAHAVAHTYDFSTSPRFAASIAFVGVLFVSAYAFGLPDVRRGLRETATSSFLAVALAVVCVSLVQLFTGDALLPRFVVFGTAAILVPWFVIVSGLAGSARVHALASDRVLLVGSPQEAVTLEADLRLETERAAFLVAAVTPSQVAPQPEDPTPLVAVARTHGANVVILGRGAVAEDAIVHQAAALHERGLRVRTVSLFYEQWLGKIPANELERVSLMFDISEVHRVVYLRSSRIFDIAVSALGLVPLLLVMPVVLVANAVGNRGPMFYRQDRVGKNGALFSIVKFRTMSPSTAGLVNEWTSEDDPRITPFGKILRLTHLDELPQVLNILRGHLSVVGPRPEQPHYVDELVTKLPFYDLRHLVRPGLTGWAQVKYGYGGNESDALEKLQYEFFYLRHQSLSLDARIVVRTLRTVLGGEGR